MFGRKDHVIIGKQEPEKMSGIGIEVQTNDFNQVKKEIATVAKVKYGAKVSINTKTVVVEDLLQVKETVKLKEAGGL